MAPGYNARRMETMSKSTLRTTDHLQQTVAALARLLDQTLNDIQVLDSEFQERLMLTAQEVEASVEKRAAEHLKFAIEKAEKNTRTLITQELQPKLDELLAERDKQREEIARLKQGAAHGAAQWETEKAQLMADRQQANQLLEQSKDAHNRALAETDEAAAIALEVQVAAAVERVRAETAVQAAHWNAERAQLIAERDSAIQLAADREAKHQQALAETERAATTRLETERAQLLDQIQQANAAAAAKAAETPSVDLKAFQAEVSRIEDQIEAISQAIEDPSTELSIVIRKNAERAELESYLRGIRFNMPAK